MWRSDLHLTERFGEASSTPAPPTRGPLLCREGALVVGLVPLPAQPSWRHSVTTSSLTLVMPLVTLPACGPSVAPFLLPLLASLLLLARLPIVVPIFLCLCVVVCVQDSVVRWEFPASFVHVGPVLRGLYSSSWAVSSSSATSRVVRGSLIGGLSTVEAS